MSGGADALLDTVTVAVLRGVVAKNCFLNALKCDRVDLFV
jgi:hypothetical protein